MVTRCVGSWTRNCLSTLQICRCPRLSPTARIIARALKRYGAVVGDRSGVGNNVTIKLEDTAVEGKGNLWANAGLRFDSLRNIPLSAYRIDRLGAGR